MTEVLFFPKPLHGLGCTLLPEQIAAHKLDCESRAAYNAGALCCLIAVT
jgi:hypothetical protein